MTRAIVPEPWTEHAVCAQTDPEIFFPSKGGGAAAAKRVCAVCPVTKECLEYSLAKGEQHGVWGGLSDRQRRAEAKRRGLKLSTDRQLEPCGTLAAYRRHYRDGEQPCEACIRANARRKKPRGAAA